MLLFHKLLKSSYCPVIPPLMPPPNTKWGAAIPWSVLPDPFSFALLPN